MQKYKKRGKSAINLSLFIEEIDLNKAKIGQIFLYLFYNL
jgi:hypothetical protein